MSYVKNLAKCQQTVHIGVAIFAAVLAIVLTYMMIRDYSAVELSECKMAKVIMFTHRPAGKALVCALWLFVGVIFSKCILTHFNK